MNTGQPWQKDLGPALSIQSPCWKFLVLPTQKLLSYQAIMIFTLIVLQADATSSEAIDKQKVLVSMLTSVPIKGSAVKASLNANGYLDVAALEQDCSRTCCVGDLQVCERGGGAHAYSRFRDVFRSFGCPSWDHLVQQKKMRAMHSLQSTSSTSVWTLALTIQVQ